jgi:hypothetical protein
VKRTIWSAVLMGVLAVAPATFGEENKVNERQQNQQKRIGEGVENGSLSSTEAARVEKQESRIHKEVKTERAANGGSLTPAERAQVNRQQNRESRRIYRQKHDGNNK